MSVSKIRTNFHANSEALINKQINMELHASYVYMSMVQGKIIKSINAEFTYLIPHFFIS